MVLNFSLIISPTLAEVEGCCPRSVPVNQHDFTLSSFSGRDRNASFNQVIVLKAAIAGRKPFRNLHITVWAKNETKI